MSDCIFCSIVNGNIPSNKVYEDDEILAFRDIAPEALVHIVIVPKLHVANILDLDESSDLGQKMLKVASKIAKDEGIAESGFRIVNNCNADGGQTVFHLHFHLLGGRNLKWPPG